jgi:hypothetical protein
LVAISRSEGLAIDSAGCIFPITNLFDRDGEETDDMEAAVVFVAGPDAHGRWWQAEFAAFEGGVRH